MVSAATSGSDENDDYASSVLTGCEKFWLLLDCIIALTDMAFDIIMIHEFYINDEMMYLWIGVGTILAPVVVAKMSTCICMSCTPVTGCIQDAESMCYFYPQFLPGINMIVSVCYAIVLPRGKFKTKATRMEQVYRETRAFEAFFEAAPQVVFQVLLALNEVGGIQMHILIVSVALSFFSVTKTMVTFFIFEDYFEFFYTRQVGRMTYSGNYQRTIKNEFTDNGTKAQMFLLALFYGIFEVISVVLSITLLGYFCGWYSIFISYTI